MQRLFGAFLAALAIASPCVAQRGWVSGSVVDSTGVPLAYANVIILGTTFGAMTDKDGLFRVEVPPGRYVLRTLMTGYRRIDLPVSVGLEEDTHVAVVLRDPVVYVYPSHGVRGAKPTVVTPYRLERSPPGSYPLTTEPVRSGSLEFVVRYTLTQGGDSTTARVIAEGQNVTDEVVRVCGCFSFWRVEFGHGPEVRDSIPLGGHYYYKGPVLDVGRQECDSPELECEPVVLAPGELVSREMSFGFDAEAFKNWTGEVAVTCVFFQGGRGEAWVDTENVVLGPLVVPIRPIGMPYRRQ